jgi:hypothetical protein
MGVSDNDELQQAGYASPRQRARKIEWMIALFS